MTTTELTTLLTGLWAKVKSHVTTAINGLATKSELANYCPIIEDTRQNNSQALTGVAPFSSLVDGQRIILNKLKFTIVNNPTLQLTLSNGTQTEAIPMWCDYAGGSALKTGWGGLVHSGGVIELLYEESNNRWVLIGQLDTNTTFASMLQMHIDNSSSTYQVVSAALLRTNFYLKSETDTLLSSKQGKRKAVLKCDVLLTNPTFTAAELEELLDTYYSDWESDELLVAVYDNIAENISARTISGVMLSKQGYAALNTAGVELDTGGKGGILCNNIYSNATLGVDTYVDLGTTDVPAPTIASGVYVDPADEFIFTFTCESASPNITLPQGVALADGFDWSEADAGVKFQVSIQDNIAAYLVFTPNT